MVLLQRRYQGYAAKQISTILIKKLPKGLNICPDYPQVKRQNGSSRLYARTKTERKQECSSRCSDFNHDNNKALLKML